MWTRELLKRNAKEIFKAKKMQPITDRQKKYLKEITGLVLVCHLYLQR